MTDDEMHTVAWIGAHTHAIMVRDRIDRLRQRLREDSPEGQVLLYLRGVIWHLAADAAERVVAGRKGASRG